MELPLPAAAPWLAPALWLVARGTVLLVLAGLAALALRRSSAAARHLAWGLALAGMLILPALTLAAPRWELSWVRVVSFEAPAVALPGLAAAGVERGVSWGTLVLAAWALGVMLTLGRYGMAVLRVRGIARRATPVTGGEWGWHLAATARELGMREPVRLLRAEGAAMPMTWGILRPVVLVPAESDAWTAERKRVVLLHELSHVARRDCLWQTLVRLVCAAYWFHPGVWWVARQMHVEREQACDDRVLGAGTRASDYAGHLLEVARSFRGGSFPAAAAVALARRSQLEERVVAVLDAARARGRVPARMTVLACGVAAVVLFPLAAASPGRFQAPAPAERVALAPERAAPPLQFSVDSEEVATDAAVSVPLPSTPGVRLNVRVPETVETHEAERPYPEPFPELAMNDEATLAALMRATQDVDPEVRRSAVWALGRMDGGVVVGSLVRSMNDSDARVRTAAALALGEYAERQESTRVAAARRPNDDSLRVPTGAAPAVGKPPRAARTDIGGGGPSDPALRILSSLAEEDSLPDAERLEEL